jgi:hypothetical protein
VVRCDSATVDGHASPSGQTDAAGVTLLWI